MENHSNSEKVFKILSIDGGGIKGIYSAKILEQFEKKFNCHIVDYFDLICGTSTGGLIALALSIKTTAEEIVSFYYDKGKLIFPKINKVKGFLKQAGWGGKHDNKELSKALYEIFGNRKIGDSNCLLCIPSFSITDGRPYIFKYDHSEGNLSRDNQTKYVEIAIATSAAPTYLPIVQIESHENKQFIDGGVYANDPTLIGIAEALEYFVGANKGFDRLMIMSVASLESPGGSPILEKKNLSILDWKTDLIQPFMLGQAHTTHYVVKTLAKNHNPPFEYIRIPSVHFSPEQSKLITLDNTEKKALDLMKGYGRDRGLLYEKMPEVAHFFESQKQYIIR